MRLAAPVLALVLATGTVAPRVDPASSVDPFVGTGGHGHTYPGATLPFGMVQLSPDTRLEGWDGCSGYHFSDRVVYGFSHTHLSGTGISDYGDVLFMPLTGAPSFDHERYASRFDKATERAEPGWYAVRLEDYGIDVELTATERTGLQRYRFPKGRPAWVVLDLAHRDEVLASSLRPVGDREVAGMRRSTGWARDQVVYFVARFSRPWIAVGRAGGEDARAGAKARFAFGDGGGELLVRVGISAVDVEGARRNLDAEQGERTFEDVRQAARRAWNESLGKIAIVGGTPAERETFYTALYHALIVPDVWSDVDGRYRGMDGAIHRAVGRRQYTVFSLWDTFRSAHPLYTLIEPDRAREFVETFLAQYRAGGRLPVWELAANETDTMIGYHAVPVIADAWLKGIRGYDADLALEAMVHSATLDHFGLASYRRQGYIGGDDDGESVSKTLEYAFDDFCIARMAGALDRNELAAEYLRRAQAWRHVLDPETGFMRPKHDQRFLDPFDPRRVDNHYTEANAWQYSFFVPQDVPGLIEALGGDERFVERLDALFESPSATTGREQPDIAGLIGQYAHGNEPSHATAWLYHHAGRPDASARRVRQVLDTLYAPEPDGLSGNEDCGQMSSWYVLAAIGLFPATPCADQYLLGVPRFERVTLDLGDGRRFTVRTDGIPPSSDPAFIESASLNGKPLTRSYVRYAEIVAGGELVLKLARQPGSAFGRAPGDRPGRWPTGPRVPAVPYLVSKSDRFRDSLVVELASPDRDATIRYAVVDAETGQPGPWRTYDGALRIVESTRLRFFSEMDRGKSPEVEAYLHRIPNDWTVTLDCVPNPQYTAGGPDALVDGLRGSGQWRAGGWVGVQGQDFRATVDLGRPRSLAGLGAGFLQDQRSWIWMPVEVVFSVSGDGTTYREVARSKPAVAPDAEGVVLRDVRADLPAKVTARYVRVEARNLGTIPTWHPGRGGQAFLFMDEIAIDVIDER